MEVHGERGTHQMPPEVEGRKNQENILYFIFLNLFLLNIEGKEDLVNEKIIREKISRIEYYLRRNSTKADASER